MYDKINWDLLAKYLAGECTVEEKSLVENWLAADPLNEELFEYLKSVWETSGAESMQWDVDDAWQKVAARVGISSRGFMLRKSLPSSFAKKKSKRLSVKFISSLALIISLACFAYIYKISNDQFQVSPSIYKPALHEMITGKGQRARLKFSDGSEVILNSASKIKFPNKFSGKKRMVYLDGEAYFKVVHNENFPFQVKISSGTIKDIGTEFNVKAWKQDGTVDVTVKEGKVAVLSENEKHNKIVYLSKGQSSKLTETGVFTQPESVNIERKLGWLKGNLYFENSTLNDVFKMIDRSYGFNCTIEDSALLSLHLTANFSEEPVKNIARIIALALNLDYKFTKEGCFYYPGKKFQIKNRKKLKL